MINALRSADADAVCGGEYAKPSQSRAAHRNGYRHRGLETRAGTIDAAIPKLRSGTSFPNRLLEKRKRAEPALFTVIADYYLAGASTRRMDKLVHQLGIDSLSKSQVSGTTQELDEHIEAFRYRPLTDASPFVFLAADALTTKAIQGGRVINALCMVATGSTRTGAGKCSGYEWPHLRPERRGTSSSRMRSRIATTVGAVVESHRPRNPQLAVAPPHRRSLLSSPCRCPSLRRPGGAEPCRSSWGGRPSTRR